MIIYDGTGAKILDVTVDDNSYRHRVIMGDHNLTLHYSLAEHVEIPVGAYCDFQGERYTLERPESLKMQHSRNFEYTVVMESSQAKARIWKFRNPVDGRLKFSLTAKPKEHLQMFIDNMNRRDSGWKVGKCVEGPEILINYNHAYCIDALGQMASECKTEYEFAGKTVSLCKVEYNKNNPLPLSYGRGNGFKPGVGRSNYGDTPPVEILFVQGGTQNIDASKYGSTELLLPKNQTIRYDGVYFEDEEGFNADNARTYITDDLGLSIRRGDKAMTSLAEDSLDCSEVYPKRVGEISGVVVVDEAKNFYDIIDDGIPEALDYADCLIEGETMTVIFQSGMLSGREFEVKYFHDAADEKAARRFEIVPAEIDGQTMPNGTFAPKAGDTYAVFNCRMPDAYVCDDATKSGASWDMFRTGVKYLFENEEQKFSFTGELDGIWSKKDWVNIGGRIILGGYIRFTDDRFQKEGVLVRITGIKDYINNPYSPVVELSNSTIGTSVASTLQQLESEEVLVEKLHGEALQFTKRRFRDAKETMAMLEDALLDNFTNSINPIAVQTMQMLVGDESLQFRFVNSKTDPVAVAHNVTYDGTAKQLKAPAGIIQHLTLGISTLSSEHKPSEYKYWDMSEYTSAALNDGSKKFYLYAKVSKTAQTGVFLLSETAIKLDGVSGFYHLLVGILNSEYDGERSFVTLYGFSEILPGRITTDKVVSGDGNSYFDMLNNAMKLGDALDFNSKGDHKLRLKGTLVQSQSGDEDYMGVYRGTYNATHTYYQGDEVVFTINGVTSTYRYIYSTPSSGIDPSHSAYWQVVAQGVKGEDGKYTELRFARNGSPTVPPDLDQRALNPSGWATTTPTVGTAEYLWMTSAEKSADGSTLISSWSTPVRMTGIKGNDGADGKSPAMVYRGEYNSSGTYYGNQYRLDCVKYNGTYFIARIDAGTFTGYTPSNTSKWNPFGASFESVATQLLLAENANIAGWIFRNNRLESQNGNIYLDGVKGDIRTKGTVQFSTGYTGNFSDVNIFYLPAITSDKTITMGYEREDVGKVCRLYNSSSFGGATYKVRVCAFGISDNFTDATIGSDKGMRYDVLVPPQTAVELTCYELPKTFDGTTYDLVARWDVSGRFGTTDFVTGGAVGRFPLVLGMGTITMSGAKMSVSGYFYDGRSINSALTITRDGSGNYNFSWASGVIPSGYQVILSPLGDIDRLYVYQKLSTSFRVYAKTLRLMSGEWYELDTQYTDVSFEFIIFGPYWWYNMK